MSNHLIALSDCMTHFSHTNLLYDIGAPNRGFWSIVET